MGGYRNPIANWGWREWVPFLICVGFGQDVMKSVDEAVRPHWGSWPAFAAKIAAGFVATAVPMVVWFYFLAPRLTAKPKPAPNAAADQPGG